MSGFYSKMLINIRNLYFNNSDDMKTILHGIFLDAADVFLNGYTPSYCEENELMLFLKTGIRFRSSTFRISITERKRSGRIQISKTNN